MPLLFRPSPVAGRAIAWRSAGRDAAASPRALIPLAAVRHFFRDHSTGPQDGAYDDGLYGHRHSSGHHHPHPHRRGHPNNRKAPELSSDWPTLYLGSKLALWSGLCYLPYETLPRSLQEEGLRLVAYGRTSYTCWYVADGCVDFDALPRRAFPRRSSQPSPDPGEGLAEGSSGATREATPVTSGPADGEGAGRATAAPAAAADTPTNGAVTDVDGSSGRATGGSLKGAGGGAGAHRTSAGPGSETKVAPDEQPGQRAREYLDGRGGPGTTGKGVDGLAAGDGGGTLARAHGQARGGGGPTHPPAPSPSHPHSHPNSHSHGHTLRDGHIHLQREQPALHLKAGHNRAAPARPPGPTAAGTPGTRCRFIFLRGVHWAAPDTNTFSLSASLASFWPSALLPSEGGAAGAGAAAAGSAPPAAVASAAPSSAPEQLVAHSGVAAMARELLPVLLPHIRDAEAEGVEHLVFAGHSLGGSLAKLLWAMSILQGHSCPDSTSCHTFGSPPVLAHAGGGGGERVLRLLRAPPAAAVNWALEHDPVPRAMLTADPYFAAARRSVPGLSALLALRGAVLGEGAALSSGRFLYETVGELLLLRWSTKGGCEVVPVAETESESVLQMALDEVVSAPVRTLQYWLDHHHASYHHDLETAALVAYRRLVRSQRPDVSHRHHHHPHQTNHEQQQQQRVLQTGLPQEQRQTPRHESQLQAAEATGQELPAR